MSVGNNFDPDLIYEVVFSGGELLPPREEHTSSSWMTNEVRRSYTQTGNHRRVFGRDVRPTLPSPGEDQINPEVEDDSSSLLNIEEDLKWKP